jgi:hypothetical protein
MEFTTTISEQDYVAGHRLAHKSVLMTVLSVWLYLLFAWSLFVFVTGLIMRSKYPLTGSDGLVVLFLIGIFWIYLPYTVRRRYRKDPSQHGEMVVQLGSEGVSERSSTGSSSSRAWTVCSYWRESKRVIMLMTHSGIYFTFPKACLSNEQRDELRSILAKALPKR